ncbi:polysaccharide lyase 6 family protein [Flavobacteriaceae bacterium]|nr:polysaccharide lyase 6 family protein [Flavobacteriaceae bacterium]
MRNILSILTLLILLFFSCQPQGEKQTLVHTLEEYNQAVNLAKPGSTIVLANGVWENAELLFQGKGTAEAPITLTVEEKGKVTLEGQSYLQIAGEYLHVEGLVFKNGYTPTNEVISFRKNNKELAYNSRLSECVIDNYSNPERHEQDSWVALYGKNNRVDHNHFEGKGNRGVTLIVRLNTKESIENNHIIEANYFGPRQNLGSNGGETLRVGTSHYSMEKSNTLVQGNYFDRCDGEHEIISNKCDQTTYKNNVFFESIGTLTMRHGDETLVEGNVFLGNRKRNTGGIRVINGQQTVRNNYGYGLTGYRFRGALVVMNGVPNSPLNRYFQVEDAIIENNVFVDSDHVQLCAGSDAERSATPINSTFKNNTFYLEKPSKLVTIYDDISGIAFENNLTNHPINKTLTSGFEVENMSLTKDKNGLLMPMIGEKVIAPALADEIPTKENTGAAWYSKADKRIAFESGKTTSVAAGVNTLFDAIKNSQPGDILELKDSERYELTKLPLIQHPLTIQASEGKTPLILWEKKAAFDIVNGGELRLKDLTFDGENAPDGSGNAVIRTSKYSMNKNYSLRIENCAFDNLDVNHSFDVIRIYKNTFADEIHISNSTFNNITGHVMALDKETDDVGIYNAEFVTLHNNIFTNIGGAVLSLHRGGKDESTFGPFLDMDHCTFENVGFDSRNKYKAAINLYGVQDIQMKNSIFKKTKKIQMHLVVGEPIVKVDHLQLDQKNLIKVSGDQKYSIGKLFTSPKLNPKGTDGKVIGRINPTKK